MAEARRLGEDLLASLRRSGAVAHWYRKVRRGRQGWCIQLRATEPKEYFVPIGALSQWLADMRVGGRTRG